MAGGEAGRSIWHAGRAGAGLGDINPDNGLFGPVFAFFGPITVYFFRGLATIVPVPRMNKDAGGAPDRTLPFRISGCHKNRRSVTR